MLVCFRSACDRLSSDDHCVAHLYHLCAVRVHIDHRRAVVHETPTAVRLPYAYADL